MKEKINLHEQLNRMKNLFGYRKGVVISEQETNTDLQAADNDYTNDQTWKSQKPDENHGLRQCNTNYNGPCNLIWDGYIKNYMDEKLWVKKFGTQVPTTVAGKENPMKEQPATNATNTPKVSNLPSGTGQLAPLELRFDMDGKTGVEFFQDWLDTHKPGWHKKYKTLGANKAKGYGKFGPNTSSAWATHKIEFLKQNPTASKNVESTIMSKKETPQSQVPQQLQNAKPIDVTTIRPDENTPNAFYKKLYDANLIKGEGDRVKYKGPDLSPEQLDLLNQAFKNMGYDTAVSKGEKRYGQKYLWKKSEGPQPSSDNSEFDTASVED